MNTELATKYNNLQALLKEMGSVAVSFSGGVDSTLVLKVAHDVLGEHAVAFTVESDFVPEREIEGARAFCAQEGVEHVVEAFPILEVAHVKKNPHDRCYYCKYAIFKHLKAEAGHRGIAYVVDGTNRDDDSDYRPGRAALRELRIRSPLHQCGMGKADIRALSKDLGIAGWDRPSAACLASRIPYGEHLSHAKLARVNHAEAFLMEKGFRMLRVRAEGAEGKTARIELMPADMDRFFTPAMRRATDEAFRLLGFTHVSLDLRGYRMGSMNEGLHLSHEERHG